MPDEIPKWSDDTAIFAVAFIGAIDDLRGVYEGGLARDLMSSIVESDYILLLSNEMLFELARVLRYPHVLELHGLSGEPIYNYVGFLREAAEMVMPNPFIDRVDSRRKRRHRHADGADRRS
jgi:hypothetical protein